MSGWRGGVWELTPTKARLWHRHSAAACAGSVEADLERAGFVVRDGRTWWEVEGPGTAEQCACSIWEALSGLPADHDRSYQCRKAED